MLCGETNSNIPAKRSAEGRYEIRENEEEEEEEEEKEGLASVAGEIESHVSAVQITYQVIQMLTRLV